MMIDRAARKVGELGTCGRYAGLSGLIGIADDRIGVCYVEIVSNQGDAKRRVQMVKKHGTDFGMPSPLVSRSSVMRFASFAFAPANPCTQPVMMSLGR